MARVHRITRSVCAHRRTGDWEPQKICETNLNANRRVHPARPYGSHRKDKLIACIQRPPLNKQLRPFSSESDRGGQNQLTRIETSQIQASNLKGSLTIFVIASNY